MWLIESYKESLKEKLPLTISVRITYIYVTKEIYFTALREEWRIYTSQKQCFEGQMT